MTKSTNEIPLLSKTISIPSSPNSRYLDLPFTVPPEAGLVGLRASFKRQGGLPRVFFSLFSPDGYRGSKLKFPNNGNVNCDMWTTPEDASPGCIPGPISSGQWRLRLDLREIDAGFDIDLHIYARVQPPVETHPAPFFDQRILNTQPGWYRGELHAHTTESDGSLSVSELITYAEESKLDYLSISDHVTVSQWWRVDRDRPPNLTLINACEMTGKHGHANMHGLTGWVDTFIGENGRTINDVAANVHARGGLICVNHALISSVLGWRYADFDWHNADLMEIFHAMLGPNNTPLIALWDGLLRQGFRVIGVGGTDMHDPEVAIERLGQFATHVYARELSQPAIIEGLRSGQVFISTGPILEFQVRNAAGKTALMGGRLSAGAEPVTLTTQVRAPEPLRITFIKDGFFLHSEITRPDPDGVARISLTDTYTGPAYYRVELHRPDPHPVYPEIEWRDHTHIRVLGNPVWVD